MWASEAGARGLAPLRCPRSPFIGSQQSMFAVSPQSSFVVSLSNHTDLHRWLEPPTPV